MSDTIPAILYAAKSTKDKRGSIETQLADCRADAEAEGHQVVAEYSDEAKSGYSGNRGPELVRAREHAERIGSELWVQHTDRLARGDGKSAMHLVEHVLWAWKAGVTLRSVQDPDACRDLLYAAVNGTRNHEDSARKSAATRAGLKRRKERGKPVGPVPHGYTVEKRVVDDETVTKRVIDPATSPTVERIFEMVEKGKTFGDVAKTLNNEGIRTRPRKNAPNGKPWVANTISGVVDNRAYIGEKGYPKIVDEALFDRVQANRRRSDPVMVARQHRGRGGAEESFLRGILRCRSCGSSLYTRKYAAGRTYVCRHRLLGSGVCSAPAIPAELIESHVLRHLDGFVGEVEAWLGEQVAQRHNELQKREAALQRQRAQLADLDRKRERQFAKYMQLADEDDPTARVAAEAVDRLDRERADHEQAIQEAEAVVSEHNGPPDVDAGLDRYNQLVDQVHGRIAKAEGVKELNDALSTVIAGLWAEIEEDRERLLVEFELVDGPIAEALPNGQPTWESRLRKVLGSRRPVLPPVSTVDGPSQPRPLRQIESKPPYTWRIAQSIAAPPFTTGSRRFRSGRFAPPALPFGAGARPGGLPPPSGRR